MFLSLVVFPFLVVLASLFLYRHGGKKEILRFDLVQFLYAFIVSPLIFIWVKSFLFFVVRNEVGLSFTLRELFVLDTTFSLVFMFIYGFLVVHSLTKSFELKRTADPLYDLFHDSEHLHLWISHAMMYVATFVLLSLFSGLNLAYPLDYNTGKISFYTAMLIAITSGWSFYLVIWMTEIDLRFTRFMQLCFGVFFLWQAVAYLVLEPSFSPSYLPYWFMLMMSLGSVVAALVLKKSSRSKNFFKRLLAKKEPTLLEKLHLPS